MLIWLSLIGFILNAEAGVGASERAYERTTDLVERLYMHPETVTPSSLLAAAAAHLTRRIDWLLQEEQNGVITLKHGGGDTIISASVTSYEDLPPTLLEIENAFLTSPHPLNDLNIRDELLIGLSTGLDKYSRVLTGENLQNFDTRLKGTLVGIGATLRSTDNHLLIVSTILGGPADLAGLRAGDVIERIDQISTINMPLRQAIGKIQGESDTQLTLTVLRDDERIEFTVTRAQVTIPNVTQEMLDEGVGYIKISHISQKTEANLKSALSSLRDLGGLSRGLVIDLRGNTGGSMKEAARAADQFLTSGILLKTVGPDGLPVQNLQARMDAIDTNTEPPIPLVVLVDNRTASGAEILAGSLLEHERAVLIGTTTYGKGSVQKIFTLDENIRLKLTVAEYFLANERKINQIGIRPDVNLSMVTLSENGIRLQPPQKAIDDAWLPVVFETSGWNGKEETPEDIAKILAVRAISATKGSTRLQLLESLNRETERESNIQRGHLLSALEEKGINWSAGSPSDLPPDLRLKLTSILPTSDNNKLTLTAELTNLGDLPIGQTMLLFSSEDSSMWENIIVPIGWIEPGETSISQTTIPLRAGIITRVDDVNVTVHSSTQSPLQLEQHSVIVESNRIPTVAVQAEYVAKSAGNSEIAVRIKNFSKNHLSNVVVYFEHPSEIAMELVDEAASMQSLGVGQENQVRLKVKPLGPLPETLPLNIVIESENFGTIAKWPISLPKNGESIRVMAPRITDAEPALRLPTGQHPITFAVTDDRVIQHAMVYVNGQKIAWHDVQEKRIAMNVSANIEEGQNILVVIAEDDQGVRSRYQRIIKGDAPAAVDAEDDESETSADKAH